MENSPRTNPYDADRGSFRPGDGRRPRARAYWIVFAVAVVLTALSSIPPIIAMSSDASASRLLLGLAQAVTSICTTVAGVALGLAVATGITEDRLRMLVGAGITALGACSLALWNMYLQVGGSLGQVGVGHVLGAFSTPLIVAGIVCLLAGWRVRRR